MHVCVRWSRVCFCVLFGTKAMDGACFASVCSCRNASRCAFEPALHILSTPAHMHTHERRCNNYTENFRCLSGHCTSYMHVCVEYYCMCFVWFLRNLIFSRRVRREYVDASCACLLS
jgi:hypothetical protein